MFYGIVRVINVYNNNNRWLLPLEQAHACKKIHLRKKLGWKSKCDQVDDLLEYNIGDCIVHLDGFEQIRPVQSTAF